MVCLCELQAELKIAAYQRERALATPRALAGPPSPPLSPFLPPSARAPSLPPSLPPSLCAQAHADETITGDKDAQDGSSQEAQPPAPQPRGDDSDSQPTLNTLSRALQVLDLVAGAVNAELLAPHEAVAECQLLTSVSTIGLAFDPASLRYASISRSLLPYNRSLLTLTHTSE